jgi:DNA segregation ATPase FtsK/SpoIIIE-like protein
MPGWIDEVGAFALIILGGVIFSALLSATGEGTLSTTLTDGLRQAFGLGAYLVSFTAITLGVIMLLPKFGVNIKLTWVQIMALEMIFLSLEGLFHLLSFEPEGRALARAGEGGGHVGWAISSMFSSILGNWLAIFFLVIISLYCLLLVFKVRREHFRTVLSWVSEHAQELSNRLRSAIESGAAVSTVPSASLTEQSAGHQKTTEAQTETRSVTPASEPETPSPARRPRQQKEKKTGRRQAPREQAAAAMPAMPSMPVSTPDKQLKESSEQKTASDNTDLDIDSITVSVTSASETSTEQAPPNGQLHDSASDRDTDKTSAEALEQEERQTTLTINGRVITATLPNETRPTVEFPKTKSKRKRRNINQQRRHFVVDGYQDKVKIGKRDDSLPSLELLSYSDLKLPTEEEINTNAQIIENTMLEFDIDADVIDVRIGPTVTQYAISPIKEIIDEDGERTIVRTRVGKIAALANDLALALSARRLRIQAPVPGHSYVGIEVPNREPSIVALRSVLESEVFYKERKKPLILPLGRDVSGEPVVTDLAIMPHLLIAGTTGSGKSVCLISLITSLVMQNTPQKLRLILLDPKRVELSQFNGLPHLLGPVETEIERIIGVLRWAAREMDRRYKLLELENARNIDAYNDILGWRRKSEHLPYIVLVIDEIGDLMMTRPDETEKTLTRLAQKARAAGMHLMIATQRPSVDVVTGLIKANFPARMSFAVASGTDSRVILDSVGAETLVGKGDMLFLAADAGEPIRVQGCFVSDEELENVVNYWRDWHEEKIEEEEIEAPPAVAPWERAMTRLESLSEIDPILEDALKLVVMEGNASTSLLQRRLGISYPRAASLMDSLYELGIIGSPQSGGRTRDVNVKSLEQARKMIHNNRRKRV